MSKTSFLKIILSTLLSTSLILAIVFSYLYFKGLSGIRLYKNGKDTIKVACVGNSVTYGYGISNWPKNNYPFILESFLGDEYTVNNYGKAGTVYRVMEISLKTKESL